MATVAPVRESTAPTRRERHLEVARPPSLRSVVADAVRMADDADPATVVDDLLGTLDPDLLAEAARRGLAGIATQVASQERNRAMTPATTGLGKWDRAKVHADVFGLRICVGVDGSGHGVWKFLRECDKADLRGAEDIYRNKAAGLIATADQYSTLARKLRKGQTVGELDREAVEGVFDA
jgi:hypothetical protein